MDETPQKRLKHQKRGEKKMFVDSEAVALSVIPFLNLKDLKSYVAINRRMRGTYDNDQIWRKAARSNYHNRKWNNKTKRDIKKCVHFEELTWQYTLPTLMEEVTNEYQLNLLLTFVNKSTYSDVSKNVIRMMICTLCPTFLRTHYFLRFPYYPRVDEIPDNYKHHVRSMNECTMADLGKYMIDKEEYCQSWARNNLRTSHH